MSKVSFCSIKHEFHLLIKSFIYSTKDATGDAAMDHPTQLLGYLCPSSGGQHGSNEWIQVAVNMGQ